ncbi:Sas10 C-terminal domain-containing protein [Radiomyces spectabilis]|uniref:Sas10 C-terminal domain-containing protein n=1 Tax=Radiomyces spectabilis TaxID=64574 RepID=UPI00221EFEA6|nr:Sas10 C-terminal domain-containing protein [Radiomyces spectabilis]KAI8388429.1 Sas10 C-terminal domain-containing protein [Radiomyces spectabilis]
MGKKKTAVFRDAKAKSADPRQGDKIKAIRTWDDIEHDSEDEFHEERGNILLENDRNAQDDYDLSEEEVYGLEGLDSEEEEEQELSDDEIIGGDQEEEAEVEDKTWGRSKKAYYNADEGSDLDEMQEEEAEALRIQKERLNAMDEADFMDDTMAGWGAGADQDAEADRKLVEDVNKDLDDINFDVIKTEKRRKNLPVAEKIKILQNESPELLDLLNEFKLKSEICKSLEDTITKIKAHEQQDSLEAQFILFKNHIMMVYLTNVSFYFVLKASDVRDVRGHPVIQALVELRMTLDKLEKVEKKLGSRLDDFIATLDAPAIDKTEVIPEPSKQRTKKSKKTQPSAAAAVSYSDDEDDLLDLEEEAAEDASSAVLDIEEEFKSLKKAAKAGKKRKRAFADDFGELDALDMVDMEDKIAKKRSIRDYVAKIDAKQAKLQSKYHGDSDLPYRERQPREKKGVPQPKDTSADLDEADWDEADEMVAADIDRVGSNDDDGDDYYNQVASTKSERKAAKKEQYEAERTPVMDSDYKVEDGEKRLASYQILKNKGLTPHRKKENRNARVKHRNRYESRLKKLSSVRQVVKPLQGNYGGETTGIKTNVARSVKF